MTGYHKLNFIATDLKLYKIFKMMRVSFFGTHCKPNETKQALVQVAFYAIRPGNGLGLIL